MTTTLAEFQQACAMAEKILNEYLPAIPGHRSPVNCMGGVCPSGHFAGKWVASTWFCFDPVTDQGGEILYGLQQEFCAASMFEPGHDTPLHVVDIVVGGFLRTLSERQAGPNRINFQSI